MPKMHLSNTTQLFTASGTFGEVQIVALQERVVLDISTRNYDSFGRLHREHALANLTLSAAEHLRDLLSNALDHAQSVTLDTRQTALWGDTTNRATASRRPA